MPRSARAVATRFAIERFTLPNGLRVVVNPDRSSPTVGVAVIYDVGFRSEPEGRTGFAHLFEHLMFQGSRNLAKGQHDRLIEGNGGVMNGSTHFDYTSYYELLPANALEAALFAEADRMLEVAISEENLRNQVDVVKEEIKVNVHNRAYGGFPWMYLPSIMFETFPNAHDGYGSFEDLEAATTEDAAAFFERFYAPANAVLAVSGDVATEDVQTMVERYFGQIPKRPAPQLADFNEPIPTSERRGSRTDANAPTPAIAVGYRVPHPFAAFPDYIAAVVLSSVLGDGQASRLYERLVKEERLVTHLGAYVAEFGDWLGTRDPTMFEIMAYLAEGVSYDRVLKVIDEECSRVVEDLTSEELERVTSSIASDLLSDTDQQISRTLNLALCEQQRGQAELVNETPTLVADVTADEIAKVASEWLQPSKRAVLEWRPGK
jgi:zinc protease